METSKKPSTGKVIVRGIIPYAFIVLMMIYTLDSGSELLDFGTLLP